MCRKTHLDDLHAHVFEHAAGLLGHGLFVERDVVKHLGGVAHQAAREHRQGVRTDAGATQRIRRHAASAAGVVGVEDQHARWRTAAFIG